MSKDISKDSESNWACEDVRDLLYLYVCGELDPEEEASIKQHLESCEECTAALHEHEILQKKLPSGFVDRKLFYYSQNN